MGDIEKSKFKDTLQRFYDRLVIIEHEVKQRDIKIEENQKRIREFFESDDWLNFVKLRDEFKTQKNKNAK